MLIWALLIIVLTTTPGVWGTTVADEQKIIAYCDGEYFSRSQAIQCAFEIGDVDPQDGQITPHELDLLKSTYMKWWERLIGWLVSSTKTSNVLKNCDFNKDGVITREDFDQTEHTCFPLINRKGKPSQSLCKVLKVCKRASKILGKPVY